ncbi:MAG: response regulator [Candidatus Saccharibacteria bacterium]
MTQKILIVDDEKPLARALELKLTHEGLDAKAVFNGAEAIAALKSENFDLVLLDLVMPQEDGFKVLQDIQDLGLKAAVIVSSNLSQEEDISRAKTLGAIDYFVKSDTTLADIVRKVKDYLVQ